MSKLLTTAHLLATAALAIYALSTTAELASLKHEHNRLEDRVIQEYTETEQSLHNLNTADFVVARAATLHEPEAHRNALQIVLGNMSVCETRACIDDILEGK